MARPSASPAPSGAPKGSAAAPPEPSRAGRTGHWKRRLRLTLVLLPLVLAALGAAYVFLALHYSYASGDRAGYVQKFSKKGWVCKTWEGELAMVSLPGTTAQMFPFTVRDDSVAAEINKHLGERVALSYEQHLGVPGCFGETEYFVTNVRRVQP
jgi:hypothetical protein